MNNGPGNMMFGEDSNTVGGEDGGQKETNIFEQMFFKKIREKNDIEYITHCRHYNLMLTRSNLEF